jgi:hypothetical protein
MKARMVEEWRLPNRPVHAGMTGLSATPSFRDARMLEGGAITGKLSVRLSDAELGALRSRRMPRQADDDAGALPQRARKLGPAEGGALTYPGRAGETHCYADI